MRDTRETDDSTARVPGDSGTSHDTPHAMTPVDQMPPGPPGDMTATLPPAETQLRSSGLEMAASTNGGQADRRPFCDGDPASTETVDHHATPPQRTDPVEEGRPVPA